MFIDTHTHLYVKQFDEDRSAVVKRAIEQGVKQFILPNIDESTIEPMWELVDEFPQVCFPAVAIHPCDVRKDFVPQLEIVEQELAKRQYIAVGETGIDLYWDKTTLEQQLASFIWHIEKAKEVNLPIIIHARDSFDEIFKVLNTHQDGRLTGVLHCFTGTLEQARKTIDFGLKLGIGGVLTFKKSGLDEVIRNVDLKDILLETDSPYLAPVPFRGKRNESAYVIQVAEKIAELKEISVDEVAGITTKNAVGVFGNSLIA